MNAPADTVNSPLSSASVTGGTSIENYAGTMVYMTRYLGFNNPTIQATAAAPLRLAGLTFKSVHNHNPNYPTDPQYQVQPQLDTGAGFVNVGLPLTIYAANSGATFNVNFGGYPVSAGSFSIRLVGQGFSSGTNSGTEFFSLDDVTLTSLDQASIPVLSEWMLLLLGLSVGVLGFRQFRRFSGARQ